MNQVSSWQSRSIVDRSYTLESERIVGINQKKIVHGGRSIGRGGRLKNAAK